MVFSANDLNLLENFKEIEADDVDLLKDRFCEELNKYGIKTERENLKIKVTNILNNYVIISFSDGVMQHRVTVNHDGTITMIYKVVPNDFSIEEIRACDETITFDLEVENITYFDESPCHLYPLMEPVYSNQKNRHLNGELDKYLRCNQWDTEGMEAFILIRHSWGANVVLAYRIGNKWFGKYFNSFAYHDPEAFRMLESTAQVYLRRNEPKLEMIYKDDSYKQPVTFLTAYQKSGWKNIVCKFDFQKLVEKISDHVLKR